MKTTEEIYYEMEKRGQIAPVGECAICDRERASGNIIFPWHEPLSFCRSHSGGKNHCTCDTCF